MVKVDLAVDAWRQVCPLHCIEKYCAGASGICSRFLTFLYVYRSCREHSPGGAGRLCSPVPRCVTSCIKCIFFISIILF